MLKRICTIVLVLITPIIMTACENPFDDGPRLNDIQEICELETLTVKCNDVIKSTKDAGKGWPHLLEKDREYWVEYVGVVEMGMDSDNIEMEVKGDKVYIDLPEARVLDVHIEEDSITEDTIYVSNDRFINPNEFSADDQTKILKDAKKQLKTAFERDQDIKAETTTATRNAIQNYVEKIGESIGTNYEIIWE